MAERSAETHLAEEELRCLDWALQALKAQDSPPGPLPPPQSPGVGLLLRVEPQVGERCVPKAVTLWDLGDLHTFTESKTVQLWSDTGGAERWAWCQDNPDLNLPLAGNQTSTKAASLQATGRYFSSTRFLAALACCTIQLRLHQLEEPELLEAYMCLTGRTQAKVSTLASFLYSKDQARGL